MLLSQYRFAAFELVTLEDKVPRIAAKFILLENSLSDIHHSLLADFTLTPAASSVIV
jgi:hypothetical protein